MTVPRLIAAVRMLLFVALVPALGVALALGLHAQSGAGNPAGAGEKMTEAKGTFEVKMAPTGHGPDQAVTSYSLDKTFHGALEATSKGEMLSSGDPASGNAGYVAMERVTGTLEGKAGSFSLMQQGVMAKGVDPQMNVQIVPGSGTADLSGIYGTMVIEIAGGKHSYTLRYAFSNR